ncbi:MAG: sporulation protein YtfJ [Oscillospiraceae bacterium]|nr:sporulation protein YtfJ [Oscillospiraceae bacterium]
MADSNLNKLVETALENLRTMTDANTVIGKPIEVANGTTVIPVSKVSVGFTSGGIDYKSKAAPEKEPNFGGGTVSGFTVNPTAFIVVDSEGGVRLLNVDAGKSGGGNDIVGTISGLVDKAPSMIEKITKMLKKDKNKPENADKPGDSVILNNEDIKAAEVDVKAE